MTTPRSRDRRFRRLDPRVCAAETAVRNVLRHNPGRRNAVRRRAQRSRPLAQRYAHATRLNGCGPPPRQSLAAAVQLARNPPRQLANKPGIAGLTGTHHNDVR